MSTKIPSWMKVLLAALFGLVIALAASSPDYATNLLPQANVRAAISSKQLQAAYGKLPLSFEANLGQTDDSVKFLSRGSGYSLFLTPTEAVLALSTPQGKSKTISHGPAVKPQSTPNPSPTVVRMQLVDSNQHSQVTGLDPLPGIVNYFLGNDPKHWHTNIPTYAQVKYQQVYPGVDMVYYGNQQQLEYDFVVAPGADPNLIKLAFAGVNKVSVNGEGDLTLLVGTKLVQLHKPVVYQQVNGSKQVIANNNYDINSSNQVSFNLGRYDRAQPLIIDPVLSYSTYLGGSGEDIGTGIAVDRAGNAYIIGNTGSTNFPTQNPLQAANGGGGNFDAFITKLNQNGDALLYSTYLGGSSNDYGRSIAVDRAGNAYITGRTDSTNFPTQNPLQTAYGGSSDAFITKLNQNGDALVYSTYLGGSGYDAGYGIALDRAGNAYITGYTNSTNFPTQNPLQAAKGGDYDAFITKLNQNGDALLYSTYLGGSRLDNGTGIAVDRAGNAYITGYTYSTNFPTQNPLQAANGGINDVFITKLNQNGDALLYSTYLGGSSNDNGFGIAVDRAGNAYITGRTGSTNFPTQNPLQAAYGGGGGLQCTHPELNVAEFASQNLKVSRTGR